VRHVRGRHDADPWISPERRERDSHPVLAVVTEASRAAQAARSKTKVLAETEQSLEAQERAAKAKERGARLTRDAKRRRKRPGAVEKRGGVLMKNIPVKLLEELDQTATDLARLVRRMDAQRMPTVAITSALWRGGSVTRPRHGRKRKNISDGRLSKSSSYRKVGQMCAPRTAAGYRAALGPRVHGVASGRLAPAPLDVRP
jgi:hypothetical protein